MYCIQVSVTLLPHTHAQWVKWSVVSVVVVVIAVVCLSAQKNTSSPDSGHSISAKYLQTVQNIEEKITVLSVLLFARYTLQPLKVLCFKPIDHTHLPLNVQCINHDTTVSVFLGFTIYTACICETTVCSSHGNTCIWRAGYVLYRVLVSMVLVK